MTAKKKSTRHLPPSNETLLARVDKKLNKLIGVGRKFLPVVERLVNEKEILRGQVETLLSQNESLRKTQCKCPPTAANAFIWKPLDASAGTNLGDVPTLTPELKAQPAPAPLAHSYSKGNRCFGCGLLRSAIIASNLPCVNPLGETQ